MDRTTGIRRPAVAGLFYPDDAGELRRAVDAHLLAASRDHVAAKRGPKAIVAPHAGYPYSGPIAGSAFETLHATADVARVVVIGPSHRVTFRGVALPSVDAFATPLGEVEVDAEAATAIRELPQVRVDDRPHAEEHAIEVELPFLQALWGDRFRLVPLVVGEATPVEVAEVLAHLWGGDETRIVVSSDLSHFLDYESARRADAATADAALALRSDLAPRQACGATAWNGLALAARERGLAAELLDLRSSGDTAGDRDRVVGYGAFRYQAPAGVG